MKSLDSQPSGLAESVPTTTPFDGRRTIERQGFSYLPQFITKEESEQLLEYFSSVQPLWEQRHTGEESERASKHSRRLTRPVYWLGAWQFACLGYYAEPNYRENRCVRAEPFPEVMQEILNRLQPLIKRDHQGAQGELSQDSPNTCLINYYGRETTNGIPRDYARLRMHRDGEIGPVVMFSLGQAGLLEFLDPERSPEPELGVWTRHRSVSILSGPEFKDRLYHRVSQVRTGELPIMSTSLPQFDLRRVSVSFRHVPEELIVDFADLPNERREKVRAYVASLGEKSTHFREQLLSE